MKRSDLYAKVAGHKFMRAAIVRPKSAIEELFYLQLKAMHQRDGVPMPKRQWKPIEERQFRLDFAWPDQMLCVEVQGMAHRIKERFESDAERHNILTWRNWRIYYVTGKMVRGGQAAQLVRTIFTGASK